MDDSSLKVLQIAAGRTQPPVWLDIKPRFEKKVKLYQLVVSSDIDSLLIQVSQNISLYVKTIHFIKLLSKIKASATETDAFVQVQKSSGNNIVAITETMRKLDHSRWKSGGSDAFGTATAIVIAAGCAIHIVKMRFARIATIFVDL